jgi:hypothetical protein
MNVRNIISVFVVFCLFLTPKTQAQTTSIQAIEDSLIVNADSMYNAFIPDLRQRHCETFIKQLVRALKNPNSYNYPFEKLGKHINIIQPEDKKFRMFNWVVAVSNVNVRYYGAIQMPGEALKLYPLVDNSTEIDDLETAVLSDGKWFGAIYYDIITQQIDGKDIYTLIGKNSSSITSNRKILEPMTFTDKGVVFGAPIFRQPGKAVNRFVLEYRKDVSVSMKWDKEYGAITFDRLTSQMNDPKRKNTFVPTGQYDGFRWDGSKWSFIEDVIPVQVFKDGEAPAPQPKAVKE